MRLGIVHQRTHPGQPQEHGAHERMHRSMKRRAIKPVQRTCAAQQQRFDAFRVEYNTERPHEALAMETPASVYTASPRAYPKRPRIEYPLHFLVKKVTDAGTVRFQRTLLYLANSLVEQEIGFEETDDGIWAIYFNQTLLATMDERDYIIRG
jgi:putative transposase